jgi:hypothetical protein
MAVIWGSVSLKLSVVASRQTIPSTGGRRLSQADPCSDCFTAAHATPPSPSFKDTEIPSTGLRGCLKCAGAPS